MSFLFQDAVGRGGSPPPSRPSYFDTVGRKSSGWSSGEEGEVVIMQEEGGEEAQHMEHDKIVEITEPESTGEDPEGGGEPPQSGSSVGTNKALSFLHRLRQRRQAPAPEPPPPPPSFHPPGSLPSFSEPPPPPPQNRAPNSSLPPARERGDPSSSFFATGPPPASSPGIGTFLRQAREAKASVDRFASGEETRPQDSLDFVDWENLQEFSLGEDEVEYYSDGEGDWADQPLNEEDARENFAYMVGLSVPEKMRKPLDALEVIEAKGYHHLVPRKEIRAMMEAVEQGSGSAGPSSLKGGNTVFWWGAPSDDRTLVEEAPNLS